MTIFAELGEKLKQFYGNWSLYIDIAARFVCAVLLLMWLRGILHGQGTLFRTPVILVMAVVVAALGCGTLTVLMCVMLIAAAFSAGPDLGGVVTAAVLIVFLLGLRFVPESLSAACAVPVTMYFGFAALVPVYCGLRKNASSVFAVVPGVVFYYLLTAVSGAEEILAGTTTADFAERLRRIGNAAFSTELVIACCAAAAACIITCTVRNLSLNYAFYAAAVLGNAVYVLFALIGNAVLGTQFGILLVLVGCGASAAALLLYLVVMLPLDFPRSEQFRFEDDNYYYYVKAVPKVTAEAYDGDDPDEEE